MELAVQTDWMAPGAFFCNDQGRGRVRIGKESLMSGQIMCAEVTRRFSVSPECVFDAWLDEALIGR